VTAGTAGERLDSRRQRDGAPAAGGRLPGLDGVRAWAIIIVVLSHASVPYFASAGGMAGVHLFFVLSGFLITGLLLAETEKNGRIDLLAFWGRRALRLLPALWVCVAGVLALFLLGGWATRQDLVHNAIPTLFYYANFARISSPYGPFVHTWSLAIEEQFYLTWPLVLALVLFGVRGRPRAVRAVTLALTLLLTLLSVAWRLHDGRVVVAWLPHTTAFALLAGGALAAVYRMGWRPAAWWGGPVSVGAALLLLAVPDVSHRAGYAGTWVNLPILYTAIGVVIVAAACGPGWTPWQLGPMRRIGQVSYAWYLWHFPLLLSFRRGNWGIGDHVNLGVAVAVLGSLAIAFASWYLVEAPALKLKKRLERSRIGEGLPGDPAPEGPGTREPDAHPEAAPVLLGGEATVRGSGHG
jgi:peptidoglycan/LPS O-acetylase OafA/YrhL